jgi:hypothetical protein
MYMQISANDTVTCISIARQRLGKHIPITNVHATIEGYKLLGNGAVNIIFSVKSVPRSHKGTKKTRTRVEAGSNTSTVTLRVVGGDEKESLKSETVKCGRESQETRT